MTSATKVLIGSLSLRAATGEGGRVSPVPITTTCLVGRTSHCRPYFKVSLLVAGAVLSLATRVSPLAKRSVVSARPSMEVV